MKSSTTVGTTSIVVVPAPSIKGAPDWEASTDYVAGQYVRSNNRYFLAMNSGTSGGTAPSGVNDSSDGTVTWRPCPGRTRRGVSITNQTADILYVTIGRPAVAGQGQPLVQNGTFALAGREDPQQEISVVRASGTGNVAVETW